MGCHAISVQTDVAFPGDLSEARHVRRSQLSYLLRGTILRHKPDLFQLRSSLTVLHHSLQGICKFLDDGRGSTRRHIDSVPPGRFVSCYAASAMLKDRESGVSTLSRRGRGSDRSNDRRCRWTCVRHPGGCQRRHAGRPFHSGYHREVRQVGLRHQQCRNRQANRALAAGWRNRQRHADDKSDLLFSHVTSSHTAHEGTGWPSCRPAYMT